MQVTWRRSRKESQVTCIPNASQQNMWEELGWRIETITIKRVTGRGLNWGRGFFITYTRPSTDV